MTSLIGGKRVSKTDKRIEAYGTIDELIAHISLLKDMSGIIQVNEWLFDVQDKLMVCAANFACEMWDCNIPSIKNDDIDSIEQHIDYMTDKLEPLKNFILPGGHSVISQCHICRTVCRRAERRMIDAMEIDKNNENVFLYINRLSDFLFTCARYLSKEMNISEVKWIAR